MRSGSFNMMRLQANSINSQFVETNPINVILIQWIDLNNAIVWRITYIFVIGQDML